MRYFTLDDIFIAQRKIAHPELSRALRLQLKILKIMYTQEQVTKLQSKLDSLRIVKNRLEALQSMNWLQIDFGYKDSKCCDLPIKRNTAEKIHDLLIAEYTSRVKTLQDDIENTIIINPLKL